MKKNEKKQDDARLIIILIPLIGSIIFAILGLISNAAGSGLWLAITLFFSAFPGFIGLLAGAITMIVQISRNKLNVRNVVMFGTIYLAALLIFVLSCGLGISNGENLG